jgi:hypothetical protein
MILTAILLFAQSGLELPPLGYFTARDGRIRPIYGIRANFLLGPAIEEDVVAVARMGRLEIKRAAVALRFRAGEQQQTLALAERRVLLAEDGGRLAAWVAASGELLLWDAGGLERRWVQFPDSAFAMSFHDGRVAVLSRSDEGIAHMQFNALSPQPQRQERVEADEAAFDSDGRVWRANGSRLSCGGREWEFEANISSLQALRESWVLARAGDRLYAAQCRSEELSQVPEPQP